MARLSDITREAVLKAVAECDALGQEAFLRKYGFRRATQYLLEIGGSRYDAKAIIGAAYGYSHPGKKPLTPDDFIGHKASPARRLVQLGFTVMMLRPGDGTEQQFQAP